ncbi:MAG: methyl-accepting chemotaxis protein, partial [Candidatus Omnitrophica bacterium]|nr:methyl-accepting chemotaxis protein [Candidatus Omnitrophota bacterium]
MFSLSNLKISQKLIGAFLILGILPVLIISQISLRSTTKLAEKEAESRLSGISRVKQNNVEQYFELIRGQVQTFSEDAMIIQAMKQFTYAFNRIVDDYGAEFDKNSADRVTKLRGRYQYQAENTEGVDSSAVNRWMPQDKRSLILQDLYIAENPNNIGEKEKLDVAPDGSTYSKLHQQYHPIIRSYLQKFEYYDIFFFFSETGYVVYTVFKEVDYATSLISGPYKDTNFAKAFRAARDSGQKDFVALEDFNFYEPSYNAPASFIASPIYDGEKLIGVLVFQMPVDRMNAVVQDSTGLGETGESYIVGKDYQMRTASRFNEESTILKEKIETDAVKNAFAGKTGLTHLKKNHKGKASWVTYAPIKVEGFNWAMLTEIDEKEILSAVQHLKYIIGLLTLVVAGIVIFVGFLISKMLVNPINSLVNSIRDISEGEGDLTKRIQITSQDELGQLAKWFNVFVGKIEDIIIQVKSSATQLNTANQGVTSSSRSISDGAQQQAASFEELSSSVQANASSASQANDLAQSVSKNAENTGSKMTETIDAMNNIEKSSKQITDAVAIITDIADQTNLLALNAAIEAARAGEHGKGFAVVADEVRKLAERSADSANDIVSLMTESNKQVSQGSSLSQEAGDSLKQIVENISKVAKQLESISTATQEQAATMEENTSITESNASAAEELASTSEVMQSQANNLLDLVNRFKVSEGKAVEGA